MNIVCRKTKCKYNNNQACMSKKLYIDKELNCSEYSPIEKNSLQDISKNMMEVAPEIAPFRHNKDVEIKCTANCVFNKNCRCLANGIFVNGQTGEANDLVNDLIEDDENQSHCKCTSMSKTNKKFCNIGEERLYFKNELAGKSAINEKQDSKKFLQNEQEEGQAKCFTFASK